MEEEGEEDAEGDRRPHEVEDEGQEQGCGGPGTPGVAC